MSIAEAATSVLVFWQFNVLDVIRQFTKELPQFVLSRLVRQSRDEQLRRLPWFSLFLFGLDRFLIVTLVIVIAEVTLTVFGVFLVLDLFRHF